LDGSGAPDVVGEGSDAAESAVVDASARGDEAGVFLGCGVYACSEGVVFRV